VWAGAQLYVLAPERGDLAIPQAGLRGKEEKRAIALSDPGVRGRRGHERRAFLLGQKFYGPSVESFRRDRQNPLALQTQRRFGQRHVPEEGVERRETMVARARPIAPIPLQGIEKAFEEGHIEIFDAQSGRGSTQPLSREPEQQAESVPITGDGVGTGTLLADQAFGEESLQQRG
jgi:hypothetical protein